MLVFVVFIYSVMSPFRKWDEYETGGQKLVKLCNFNDISGRKRSKTKDLGSRNKFSNMLKYVTSLPSQFNLVIHRKFQIWLTSKNIWFFSLFQHYHLKLKLPDLLVLRPVFIWKSTDFVIYKLFFVATVQKSGLFRSLWQLFIVS